MSKWFDIRIKADPRITGKYLANTIRGYPQKVFSKYYFQEIQSVLYAAVTIGRVYINQPVNATPTGTARKAAGGNGPGRVDSGLMQKAFTTDGGRRTSANRYDFKIGWITGEPGYSIFQEYGTKNGVKAMHTMLYVREFILDEMKLRASGGKGTTAGKLPENFGE